VAARLDRLERLEGITVARLSRMPLAQVRRLTGLGPVRAARARHREFSEPVIAPGVEDERRRFLSGAERLDLSLTRGGRFWQVSLGSDKGRATALLLDYLRQMDPGVVSLGLGDSPNDFPFLREVDVPYLVSRPDGGVAPGWRKEGFLRAGAPGPEGWNRVVGGVLDLLDANRARRNGHG
jgi:predicted mannosyl-3-phosphoglycerate phosphatase (HAD superfamily)